MAASHSTMSNTSDSSNALTSTSSTSDGNNGDALQPATTEATPYCQRLRGGDALLRAATDARPSASNSGDCSDAFSRQ
eukprot:5003335-Pleurochrysis_carterae.AAC.1